MKWPSVKLCDALHEVIHMVMLYYKTLMSWLLRSSNQTHFNKSQLSPFYLFRIQRQTLLEFSIFFIYFIFILTDWLRSINVYLAEQKWNNILCRCRWEQRKISWIVSLLLFLLRFYFFFFFCYVNNIVLHFRFSLFIFYLNFPAWFIIFRHFLLFFLFFSLSMQIIIILLWAHKNLDIFIVMKLGLFVVEGCAKEIGECTLLKYLARIKNPATIVFTADSIVGSVGSILIVREVRNRTTFRAWDFFSKACFLLSLEDFIRRIRGFEHEAETSSGMNSLKKLFSIIIKWHFL